MNIINIIFYISAAIAVITTLFAIAGKNPVHSILYFILSLLASGVIFFALGAPFAAALVVIINAGAIMVLFVFIVIMVNQGKETVEQEKRWTSFKMWPVPCFLAAVLLAEFIYILLQLGQGFSGRRIIQPIEVGLGLFGHYLLAVELVSMVLLVGLLGAYHLSRENSAMKKSDSED
jgi:NADH-quinone oxidoreductase subunit J